MTQAINISGTLTKSKIAFKGSTPDSFRSRTDAARNLGRVSNNSAERRRPLSIVARSYLQPLLTKLFQCSKSTVTAARVHAILFGRGGVPPASIKFSCQYVSQEVLDQLGDCLLRDDVSRPSGVKRSYIYAHIQRILKATPCLRASAILVRTMGSLILPS